MTSITTKISWKVHPWRVKRLPTIPVELSTTYFFNNRNKSIQIFLPSRQNPPFIARILPISPLKSPLPPLESGSNILRSFLYARSKWPYSPYRANAAYAMETIYNTFRVDGLPRVVFVVAKEVQQPLRGKLNAVIRHQFKRRGKAALKRALEELRRENEGTFHSRGGVINF